MVQNSLTEVAVPKGDTKASPRFLMLGGGEGWHTDQIRSACQTRDCRFSLASYESLSATTSGGKTILRCSAGELNSFDAVLARTMPMGTLEQVTFRLAILHQLVRQGIPVINPPASLETAIDKFAALALVADLGYPVPLTATTQSRQNAWDAFVEFGGDCVVKPIFGGEGRGVMRVSDPELARTTFATLEQLGAVIYLQAFVAPGGADTRLLRLGNDVISLRRTNQDDFRTNRNHGGRCQPIETEPWQRELAMRVTDSIGLQIASVDLIDDETDESAGNSTSAGQAGYRVVEINAIPGWKSAQTVCDLSIAGSIVDCLMNATRTPPMHGGPVPETLATT